MTRKQIERRLKTLGLRLERDGRGWIVRPDTVGSCSLRAGHRIEIPARGGDAGRYEGKPGRPSGMDLAEGRAGAA